MKISKTDAQKWFELFAQIQDSGEDLGIHQMEIVYSTMSQIEERVEHDHEELKAQIPHLRSLNGRTLYVGPDELFPRGCRGCLTGTGLTAIRKTNRCNIQCPFCYNYGELDCQEPIGEGLWEIGGGRYREEDLPLLFSLQGKPTGIAYVYLEPFMEIEKYYGIIRRFREAGVHQHMYTNGINANEENLKALGEAGLDELRFNLGASSAADRVIDAMAIAKKYIPRVGVETPMTREFFSALNSKKEKILATGIDFMNCAELHLNDNNLANYAGEPMYFCRMGYLSPIISRDLTLQVMKTAAEEKWPIAVHDCSNKTKIARDLNLAAREGGWFGRSVYGREIGAIPYAAFLPSLEDETLVFTEEEELPRGYRPGEIVL